MFISAVIQFIDKKILIVSFASVIGVLILFIMLENPMANIDRDTGFFNLNALFEYMKEAYGQGNDVSIVCIRYGSNENDFFTRILLLYRSVCPYSAITSFFLPPRSKKHSQNKAAANLCNNLGNELVRQLWRQTSMAACIGSQKYSGKHLSMFRRESAACKKIASGALQFSGKKQQSENILLPTAA